MNRNDFSGIIHNASLIDRQMLGEVRELVDLFPYFQSAHLLLLKGLHNMSDVKFESQLKQSAIHIADREVLYYLLRRQPLQVSEKPEAINTISEAESVTVEDKQVIIESVTTTDPQTPVESDESDSDSIVLLLDNEDSEPVEEKVVFIDPSISVPWQGDLLELDLQEDVSNESGENILAREETPVEDKNFRKQIQSELIDKFIIANPRIEPVRDKTDHPVEDISKPFTEEKGGFVTETLAKIYITQGYYSKAIDIYEKLCLKFPEKSSYFATQIEKVKELIK